MLRTLAILVLLAGTASADSKVDLKIDYDNVCNAIERSGGAKIKDKQERIRKIVAYIQKVVKTEEVKKLLGELGSMNPSDRGPALRSAAKQAGYDGACPMADEK